MVSASTTSITSSKVTRPSSRPPSSTTATLGQVVARHQPGHLLLVGVGAHRDVGVGHEVADQPIGPADHQVLERQHADQPPLAVHHEHLVEVLDLFGLAPDLVQRLLHRGRVAHGHQCVVIRPPAVSSS